MGLIPSSCWAKDSTVGFRTINARSETVTTMTSFRDLFKSQRCLIPADGFYEWVRNGKSKQPYYFEVGDGMFSHSLGYGTGGLIREEKWLRAARF